MCAFPLVFIGIVKHCSELEATPWPQLICLQMHWQVFPGLPAEPAERLSGVKNKGLDRSESEDPVVLILWPWRGDRKSNLSSRLTSLAEDPEPRLSWSHSTELGETETVHSGPRGRVLGVREGLKALARRPLRARRI